MPWRALIVAAGAIHLLIAAGNLLLPRILDYRSHLPAMDRRLRQVYRVHAFYIIVVLCIFGLLCLLFPADLAGGSALGRFLAGALAAFWGLRLVLQLAYYDRDLLREHRLLALPFTAAVAAFTGLFALAAAGALR